MAPLTLYPKFIPNLAIARALIADQFPEYAHLPVTEVGKQGHDNRTYRLGNEMLIRLPTAESYALKVPKEQLLLPQLAPHLSVSIPTPLKMGIPSRYYPYPFSLYRWLDGTSINLLTPSDDELQKLAGDLAHFLKELQSIQGLAGPVPGQHNWWRGDHISVYDGDTRKQLTKLAGVIDCDAALDLWESASRTAWNRPPVWIHGDITPGNMLLKDGVLSAVIDFGGMGIGDPACDLVIAWTLFSGKAREIFIESMALDESTWLRARAWALWKATYQLYKAEDKNGAESQEYKRIIVEVLA